MAKKRAKHNGRSWQPASAVGAADPRDGQQLIKENKLFADYYVGNGIVPPEQLEEFLNALRAELPTTFRITSFKREATHLATLLRKRFVSAFDELESVENAKDRAFLTELPWYPDGLAWQFPQPRRKLKKSSQSIVEQFRQFLIEETEIGNISRQEAVSMIPPLLMDIGQQHKVLDMCAAPGSKTAQLIEALHSANRDQLHLPTGVVVANDSDTSRCYTMVHQVKRLQSPNCLIVNHDASLFPNMYLLASADDQSNTTSSTPEQQVRFDRILADVPCSGDGTMRKNPSIWQRWSPCSGFALHSLQVRILERGVELLAVGGRIVYSTCSLNPVEDEAVVAAVLRRCAGAVRLLPAAHLLPNLKVAPGIATWRVLSKDAQWFDRFDGVPQKLHNQIRPSMFPPSSADAETFHLDRCFRILPHHQDTGGFFVAVLEKVAPLPWLAQTVDDAIAEAAENSDESCPRPAKIARERDKRPRRPAERVSKECRFVFLSADDEATWPPVRDFYGLREDLRVEQVLSRNDAAARRNMYYTSPLARELLRANADRVRFVSVGVKVLQRNSHEGVPCDFRLCQEGVHFMHPFAQQRVVRIERPDLLTLMSNEAPYFTRLSKGVQEDVAAVGVGCTVFVYEPADGANDLQGGVQVQAGSAAAAVFCGWRGRSSVHSLVPRAQRMHYLRMAGIADPTEFVRAQNAKPADHNGCPVHPDRPPSPASDCAMDAPLNEGHSLPADLTDEDAAKNDGHSLPAALAEGGTAC